MLKLRDYQIGIAEMAVETLKKFHIVYLSMEVRTGKTLTALETARLKGCVNVLFVTKKKAIKSIQNDYKLLCPGYELTVINYESLHNVTGNFDLIICDEAHTIGAFPKPALRTKQLI